MCPTKLKSSAVPVNEIVQTKRLKCDSRFVTQHVLRDLLLAEALAASCVFPVIDSWYHKHLYQKHSSVM